jgi:hypothetical protein
MGTPSLPGTSGVGRHEVRIKPAMNAKPNATARFGIDLNPDTVNCCIEKWRFIEIGEIT